jgi:hypothetical protein
VNLGSKELVEGLLRLAHTGSGPGCLHNSTIALRVIILRREGVESEEKVERGGDRLIPTLLDVQRIAAKECWWSNAQRLDTGSQENKPGLRPAESLQAV